MKTKQELKDALHRLIDSIEDESILSKLNEEVFPSVMDSKITSGEAGDELLTEEQQHNLEKTIKQAKEENITPLDELYSKMRG
jgi:hypothetical protein